MRMHIKSIPVDCQDKAQEFYTETLGFTLKHNVDLGEDRWLTLVSPEEPDGVELALEPNRYPAMKALQESLLKDGIPWTQFAVDDIAAEHKRLAQAGVRFTMPPTPAGPVTVALFDDTCGNLIQLIEGAG